MNSPRAAATLVAGALLSACVPPPPVAPAPAEARSTEQAHLLLFPQQDAEALLGRAVQASADGGYTLADVRAPGCEVRATREKAQYHARRQIDVHSMTSLSGGYARFVSLEARYGRKNTADIDVENAEIVRGDPSGACGELVVDTVFVGAGKRSIRASAEAAGGADVRVGVLAASPHVEAGQSLVDAIDWHAPQAYGFAFRKMAKTEPLALGVELPSHVREGSDVVIRFTAKRPAWLVVYYLDAKGHADVLWPSNEEPAPRASADAPAVLPSPREVAQGITLRPAVLEKGKPSRETLVVYGFADQRDFDAMKPAAGSERSDGAAYAAELTKKLELVPVSRWSRAVVGYVIDPAR